MPFVCISIFHPPIHLSIHKNQCYKRNATMKPQKVIRWISPQLMELAVAWCSRRPLCKESGVSGKCFQKCFTMDGFVFVFPLTFTNSSPHKSHFGNLSFKVHKDVNDFTYLHLQRVIFHLVKCACVCQQCYTPTYIILSSFKDLVCLPVCI